MSRKRFKPEQVLGLLRQAEVELAQGKRIGEVCRALGISEQSYYRWRSEYGGLKLEQARRMKDLEKEIWSYPDSVDGEGLRYQVL